MGKWVDLSGVYCEELIAPALVLRARRCAACKKFFRYQLGAIWRPGKRELALCRRCSAGELWLLRDDGTAEDFRLRSIRKLTSIAVREASLGDAQRRLRREVAVVDADLDRYRERWSKPTERTDAEFLEAIRDNDAAIARKLAQRSERSATRWTIRALVGVAATLIGFVAHAVFGIVADPALRPAVALGSAYVSTTVGQVEPVDDVVIVDGTLVTYSDQTVGLTRCQDGAVVTVSGVTWRCHNGWWNDGAGTSATSITSAIKASQPDPDGSRHYERR